MTVAVTRLDLSARDLRASAARSTDAKAARRMLAIALVMEGSDRAAAARSCGMDRQTLRDWVYRYNAGGLAGLSNRTAPGRTPYLSARRRRNFPRSFARVLTLRWTAWCVGGVST